MSVNKATGSGNSTFIVTVAANTSTLSRGAYVYVMTSDGKIEREIYVVQEAINALTITSVKPSVNGNKITWTTVASGGSGTYQYQYDLIVGGLGKVQTSAYSTSNSFQYEATVTGEYYVVARVKDSLGYTAERESASTQITITATYTLSVSPTSASVEAKASQKTISITSNTNWQVVVPYSCDDWISINKETGSGNGSVVVYIDENPSTASRTGSVSVLLTSTYTEKKITITQAGKASNSLTISPTTVSATATKGQYTVNVTSNTSWVVDTSSSWLTVNKTSGSGNGSVTVTAAANTSTSSRKGYVYIDSSDGKIERTATVTQAGLTTLTITSVKPSVNGNTITWTATASGGTGSLQYKYELYMDGIKIQTRNFSSSAKFEYEVLEAGEYWVVVTVKDSSGNTAALTSDVVVATDGELTVDSVKASVSGKTITWTATASGGSGTLQYQFDMYVNGIFAQRQKYSTSNKFVYEATESGSYWVVVTVMDSKGNTATKTSGETRIDSKPLVIDYIDTDVSNNIITWTVSTSGGTGVLMYDYYIYTYVDDENQIVETRLGVSSNRCVYTATSERWFCVVVKVTDNAGYSTVVTSNWTYVDNDLRITKVWTNKTSVKVGRSIRWYVEAEGGEGDLEYKFVVYRDKKKMTTRNYRSSDEFKYYPKSKGTYKAKIFARDEDGNTVHVYSGEVTVK